MIAAFACNGNCYKINKLETQEIFVGMSRYFYVRYFYYHPPSGVMFSVASVCLSVCNTITLESLDVESLFSVSARSS